MDVTRAHDHKFSLRTRVGRAYHGKASRAGGWMSVFFPKDNFKFGWQAAVAGLRVHQCVLLNLYHEAEHKLMLLPDPK